MRELMGGGQFQFPASIDVLEDPELRDLFETFWTAGEFAAADRMKLFKLAWDLIGSDHASRATSYEKFFVGPAFAVRNYNFINAPWDERQRNCDRAGSGGRRVILAAATFDWLRDQQDQPL